MRRKVCFSTAEDDPTVGSDSPRKSKRLTLTSHKQTSTDLTNITWGHEDPIKRAPIVTGVHNKKRTAIGAHGGSYMVYRALMVGCGKLVEDYKPDYTNTAPAVKIGPFPSWYDPDKMVAMDPWGAITTQVYADQIKAGTHIQPTIAVTKANINFPELKAMVDAGEVKVDGKILKANMDVSVTKAAVEPAWHLPGVAKRFGIDEVTMRRALFEQCGGMFPELVSRHDLKVYLPPIGGMTVYIVGNTDFLGDPTKKVTVRVHDECNGSDVFGSDICTCRPYLVHGLVECITAAQKGDGVGILVYFRKEGRALGEVTKFLVYNARKRQEGGDRADQYFQRTCSVAGVEDMRFQELMPDVLHWLGITRIDRLISMSDMKYNAIVNTGIEVVTRVAIPEHMIPDDARVEMDAKVAAGYWDPYADKAKAEERLQNTVGKKWDI